MRAIRDVFRLYRMRRSAASSERARERTVREVRTEALGLWRGIIWPVLWFGGWLCWYATRKVFRILRGPGPGRPTTTVRRTPTSSISRRMTTPVR